MGAPEIIQGEEGGRNEAFKNTIITNEKHFLFFLFFFYSLNFVCLERPLTPCLVMLHGYWEREREGGSWKGDGGTGQPNLPKNVFFFLFLHLYVIFKNFWLCHQIQILLDANVKIKKKTFLFFLEMVQLHVHNNFIFF